MEIEEEEGPEKPGKKSQNIQVKDLALPVPGSDLVDPDEEESDGPTDTELGLDVMTGFRVKKYGKATVADEALLSSSQRIAHSILTP